MVCEKNGCKIVVLEFVSEGFICTFTPLLMWEALTLRANHMFTPFVMKLELRGAHTTGLHWSSNSITPLINAQMLLADPVTHCFLLLTIHSVAPPPLFCSIVNGYCPTDAPVCLIMFICTALMPNLSLNLYGMWKLSQLSTPIFFTFFSYYIWGYLLYHLFYWLILCNMARNHQHLINADLPKMLNILY